MLIKPFFLLNYLFLKCINAQNQNGIDNANENGITNGFPNGNGITNLNGTKCLTSTYYNFNDVTSANQLPIPTLDSISGVPSPVKGSFIEIDFPTVDATIPNYKQTISVLTNVRGDVSTGIGCSGIIITGGCGKASAQIPSNCVPNGILSGNNIVYTILFQFSISTGVFSSKYDFSTTATIASTAKTTTQVLVTQPSVTPGTYTFLNALWNDLNQTYTVTIGVIPSVLTQFKFVGFTYTYSYLNAQNVVIPILTPSNLVNAIQDVNKAITVTFTINSLTSGCALQSFTLNGVYVAVNPQQGGAQDYSISNSGVITTLNNPKLYSDTASATAINTNASPVCNTGIAGHFTFPNAIASISSCTFYKVNHNTIDSVAVFNDYIDCVGTISNLNNVTFNIQLTGINGYNWANSNETNSHNLPCSISTSTCTSFQLAAPCANAATTQSADCYYTIVQGSSNSQLILAFTLTITSVNGVSVNGLQRRDNSLSLRDSIDANAYLGTVMTTSKSFNVFSDSVNSTSSALTKFFTNIDDISLNTLLLTTGLILTL